MIEGTYTAPNGRSLSWRTFCDDDCQEYPRPWKCCKCKYEIGALTVFDASGQRQTMVSGVVVQRMIDRAVADLKRDALAELQPPLFEMEVSLC